MIRRALRHWALPWLIAAVVGCVAWEERTSPERLYTFVRSSGPYEATFDADGRRSAGAPRDTFAPCETFAYVNDVTFRPDVAYDGKLVFRQLEASGDVAPRDVEVIPFRQAAGTRPSGSFPRHFRVPCDARPGRHALVQEDVTLRPAEGPAREVDFPPILVTIAVPRGTD